MGKALPGHHFDENAGASIAGIPPVVPYIRLDTGRLSLAQNARLSATLHSEFTFKNSEAFDYPRVAVFANDPCPDAREQFGDRTTAEGSDREARQSWRAPE
jgi:hypothetical protein